MAVWILTQMKRWGYINGEIDYRGIAEQVYVAAETGKVMKELGYQPPSSTYQNFFVTSVFFKYSTRSIRIWPRHAGKPVVPIARALFTMHPTSVSLAEDLKT